MTDITPEALDALSKAAAAALSAALKACEGSDQNAMTRAAFESTVAHEKLAFHLVNLYRTGKLVMVGDGAVERVALAITTEIGWGAFDHFDPKDVVRVSTAAIAALKGEKS